MRDPPAGAAPAPLFTSRRRAEHPPDGFHPLLHLCLGIGHEHAGVLPCPALLSSHPCRNNTFQEEKKHIPVVFLVKSFWLRISPLKPRWLQRKRSFDISHFEICKEGTETAAAAAWQSFSSPLGHGQGHGALPQPWGVDIERKKFIFPWNSPLGTLERSGSTRTGKGLAGIILGGQPSPKACEEERGILTWDDFKDEFPSFLWVSGHHLDGAPLEGQAALGQSRATP